MLGLFQLAIFPSLSCQFISVLAHSQWPRTFVLSWAKSPHSRWQSSSGDWLRLVEGGMFWFVFETVPEPYKYDWGSALGFLGWCCCCFIPLSLPLTMFEWLLPEILKLLLDGFTLKKAQWDEFSILLSCLLFFLLVLLWATLCPSTSVRTMNFWQCLFNGD